MLSYLDVIERLKVVNIVVVVVVVFFLSVFEIEWHEGL